MDLFPSTSPFVHSCISFCSPFSYVFPSSFLLLLHLLLIHNSLSQFLPCFLLFSSLFPLNFLPSCGHVRNLPHTSIVPSPVQMCSGWLSQTFCSLQTLLFIFSSRRIASDGWDGGTLKFISLFIVCMDRE